MKTRRVAEEFFHTYTQTDGRTDRYNDANCSFTHFCESV